MIRLAHPKMSVSAKWLRRWSLRFSVFVAVLALPQALRSQPAKSTWTDAAADLAAKSLARAGQPSAVSMDLSNASSLSSDDAGTVRRLLEAQLAARGARIVKPEQAVADLRFTLSENAAGLLWIAEISSGSKRDIVMTEVARSEAQSAVELAPAITLHKELIWSQYEPILDFAIWENRSRLLVLDPWTVSLYRLSNSRWSLERSLPIPHSRPSPMDTRGRLLMLRDHKFEAFVPGQHCTGTAEGGLRLECRQADDPWPLAGENSPRAFFSATRNFFTGVLTGAPSVAPFYSAAFVQTGNRDIWTFAGTDGRVRQLANGENELRVPWGSTLAGVKSGCGSGWQVLAAGTGDFAQRDLVQAFELSPGVAAVTSAVEVPGPVTAIWPTPEANAAAVVARNLTNGKYEGYGVSINCR